jgi:hypothetical protein
VILGDLGAVLGLVGVFGLFACFVAREVRLAHARRAARERMQRRRDVRWPECGAARPLSGDGPLVKTNLGSRASEGEGTP